VGAAPPDEREVPAPDLVPPQHRLERGVRLVGARDEEEPARPGVQPMDDPGRNGPPAGASGIPIASSRFTRVSSRCTVVGCVRTPAGFTTIAKRLVAVADLERVAAGLDRAGAASSTSTASPPRSGNERARAARRP
jgi:hypothetical protein